jgi:hypothetical protein
MIYSDLEIAHKFCNLYNSAKSRNKDFDLTLTSVKNLLKAKKCFYTGVELSKETLSIDRITST